MEAEKLGPSAPDKPGSGEFCSIDDLVEIIGAGKIDRKTLFSAARKGQLPGTRRIGRRFLVCLPVFMNWFRTAGLAAEVESSTATGLKA